ncbi:MAG: SAM-dependent methyltransferase [Steroidobacteraceae bacterium]|jgi:predicted methyltransferase
MSEGAEDGAPSPLLTLPVNEALIAARDAVTSSLECSLDLGLSSTRVDIEPLTWNWNQQRFPYIAACKDRSVYHWTGTSFEPISRYGNALIKLVPTPWGPPTFEIDGIKMLPTARVSPYEDARHKVALIKPRGKVILDTCAGLGYFAAWCLRGGAARVHSFERNPDVLWLRKHNPWSPDSPWSHEQRGALTLVQADITVAIRDFPAASFDAILHDPPRFGIAGELYSQEFYEQLARVLKGRGKLFHYVGTPNKQSRGRDLQREVSRRLQQAGFDTEYSGDGILALREK